MLRLTRTPPGCPRIAKSLGLFARSVRVFHAAARGASSPAPCLAPAIGSLAGLTSPVVQKRDRSVRKIGEDAVHAGVHVEQLQHVLEARGVVGHMARIEAEGVGVHL